MKKEILHKLVNIIQFISFCIVGIVGIGGCVLEIIGARKMEEILLCIGIDKGISRIANVSYVMIFLLITTTLLKEKWIKNSSN